jgi:hypothetical protein
MKLPSLPRELFCALLLITGCADAGLDDTAPEPTQGLATRADEKVLRFTHGKPGSNGSIELTVDTKGAHLTSWAELRETRIDLERDASDANRFFREHEAQGVEVVVREGYAKCRIYDTPVALEANGAGKYKGVLEQKAVDVSLSDGFAVVRYDGAVQELPAQGSDRYFVPSKPAGIEIAKVNGVYYLRRTIQWTVTPAGAKS